VLHIYRIPRPGPNYCITSSARNRNSMRVVEHRFCFSLPAANVASPRAFGSLFITTGTPNTYDNQGLPPRSVKPPGRDLYEMEIVFQTDCWPEGGIFQAKTDHTSRRLLHFISDYASISYPHRIGLLLEAIVWFAWCKELRYWFPARSG